MKKLIFGLSAILLIISLSFCEKRREEESKMISNDKLHARAILDQNAKPTAELLQLLDFLGFYNYRTFGEVVEITQNELLRGAGKERWEMPDRYEDKRDVIITLLDQLNCIKQISATETHYDYAVLLGALVSRVRSRLAFLIDQWNHGVRFGEVIFLGGARPLHQKLESEQILLDAQNVDLPFKKGWKLTGQLPKTEYEMIKMVFDQADLPDDFKKNVRVTFVDAPMQEKSDGTFRRPNTGDTVRVWLEMNSHTPGTCLVISNQPYVGYQDSVMRTLLPEDFSVETVGAHAYDDLPIVVHLDNVTRWLYQERKRRG